LWRSGCLPERFTVNLKIQQLYHNTSVILPVGFVLRTDDWLQTYDLHHELFPRVGSSKKKLLGATVLLVLIQNAKAGVKAVERDFKIHELV
jgi:hypothetical protein